MSLSKAVQILIEQDPQIQDSLERGFANYSAIARLLKAEVETFLGKEVALEGLITAVKRIKTSFEPNKKCQRVIAGSTITLKTDIAKISMENTKKNSEMARLTSIKYPDDLFQIIEGTHILTLVTDQKIFNKVPKIFGNVDKIEEKSNLAMITVKSPKEIVDTPGCIIGFYNQISKAKINIEETLSCSTETIIILEMDNAALAFNLLLKLIANTRLIVNKKKSSSDITQ